MVVVAVISSQFSVELGERQSFLGAAARTGEERDLLQLLLPVLMCFSGASRWLVRDTTSPFVWFKRNFL